MDDITACMNWKLMDKCEELFDKYKIKPLLRFFTNQDPSLLAFPKMKISGKEWIFGKRKGGR